MFTLSHFILYLFYSILFFFLLDQIAEGDGNAQSDGAAQYDGTAQGDGAAEGVGRAQLNGAAHDVGGAQRDGPAQGVIRAQGVASQVKVEMVARISRNANNDAQT